MISRLISPLIVMMPACSKALAFSPICICGKISRPRSLNDLCSQKFSVMPSLSLTELMVSTRSFLHIDAFSRLFQSLVWMVAHFHCFRFCLSTFCIPVALSIKGILSPLLSVRYTFFCFGIQCPCSSIPRIVRSMWQWRFLWPVFLFSESCIANCAHIPLLTKFRFT